MISFLIYRWRLFHMWGLGRRKGKTANDSNAPFKTRIHVKQHYSITNFQCKKKNIQLRMHKWMDKPTDEDGKKNRCAITGTHWLGSEFCVCQHRTMLTENRHGFHPYNIFNVFASLSIPPSVCASRPFSFSQYFCLILFISSHHFPTRR